MPAPLYTMHTYHDVPRGCASLMRTETGSDRLAVQLLDDRSSGLDGHLLVSNACHACGICLACTPEDDKESGDTRGTGYIDRLHSTRAVKKRRARPRSGTVRILGSRATEDVVGGCKCCMYDTGINLSVVRGFGNPELEENAAGDCGMLLFVLPVFCAASALELSCEDVAP